MTTHRSRVVGRLTRWRTTSERIRGTLPILRLGIRRTRPRRPRTELRAARIDLTEEGS
jgi:hypothetical protein